VKRWATVIFLVAVLTAGCSQGKPKVSEIQMDQVSKTVKTFIEQMEEMDHTADTGIYMFNDSNGVRYLYVNQVFLDEGKGFGGVQVERNGDSLEIYLEEAPAAEQETDAYKLYTIKAPGDYEYVKVFKNGEDTHFSAIGA